MEKYWIALGHSDLKLIIKFRNLFDISKWSVSVGYICDKVYKNINPFSHQQIIKTWPKIAINCQNVFNLKMVKSSWRTHAQPLDLPLLLEKIINIFNNSCLKEMATF